MLNVHSLTQIEGYVSEKGISAGLMMCISVMDLLPDAVESLGFQAAHVAFYLGALFFALVTVIIPDPDLDEMIPKDDNSES